MEIFIAGCARSGTGLTRDLMGCFNDLFVFEQEANVEKFAEIEGADRHTVIKRTHSSYRSLPELSQDIRLIYCIRHPVDTLTSSHPKTRHLRPFHVTTERWREEYTALDSLRQRQPLRRIFFSKYEDLVLEPDAAQNRMADFFGLTPKRRFSADPNNPIVTTSTEKWKRNEECLRYVYGLPTFFIFLLERFCAEFGYQLPQRPPTSRSADARLAPTSFP
jgi:hypothetical protein